MDFSIESIQKEIAPKIINLKIGKIEIDNQYTETNEWLNKKKLMPVNPVIAQAVVKFLVETKLGIREKGLFFVGGVGTGKTVALKIIHSMRKYNFLSCYELTEKSKTFDSGNEYMKNILTIYKTEPRKNIIFDDLGDELTINSYGIKSEFMAEVLRERHKTFISRGDLTLMSSNLGEKELEARYTPRIVSRLRQMCEVVICNGQDLRCK